MDYDDLEYFFKKYLRLKKGNPTHSNVGERLLALKRLRVIIEAEYEEYFYKKIEHEQKEKI
jgi:hypothetical protein